jgi:hypothetical protein
MLNPVFKILNSWREFSTFLHKKILSLLLIYTTKYLAWG